MYIPINKNQIIRVAHEPLHSTEYAKMPDVQNLCITNGSADAQIMWNRRALGSLQLHIVRDSIKYGIYTIYANRNRAKG